MSDEKHFEIDLTRKHFLRMFSYSLGQKRWPNKPCVDNEENNVLNDIL